MNRPIGSSRRVLNPWILSFQEENFASVQLCRLEYERFGWCTSPKYLHSFCPKPKLQLKHWDSSTLFRWKRVVDGISFSSIDSRALHLPRKRFASLTQQLMAVMAEDLIFLCNKLDRLRGEEITITAPRSLGRFQLITFANSQVATLIVPWRPNRQISKA